MMDVRTEISEFDEVLEVLERSVTTSLVEIVDEWRSVVGREHHRIAANHDVALRIARMLKVPGRRCRTQLSGQSARKADALALDVATGGAEQIERPGEVAKLDSDLL